MRPRLSRDRTSLFTSANACVLLAVAGALTVFLASGCTLFLRATPAPMPTKMVRADSATRPTTLIVFLPGRGGAITDFEREGFFTILREAGVRADVVIADAHLGYYLKRSVIDRLSADVLAPARSEGYQRIVVVGISLGGLGALLLERDQPGSTDALVLIAPYLGDRDALFQEIATTGGPAAWAAGRTPGDGEIDEEIWKFLGAHAPDLPPTWLLYGRGDSLAPGHRLLAGQLPEERVRVIDGAHDWATWRTLWREVCESSDLFADEKR